jgi:hypothetical protein
MVLGGYNTHLVVVSTLPPVALLVISIAQRIGGCKVGANRVRQQTGYGWRGLIPKPRYLLVGKISFRVACNAANTANKFAR